MSISNVQGTSEIEIPSGIVVGPSTPPIKIIMQESDLNTQSISVASDNIFTDSPQVIHLPVSFGPFGAGTISVKFAEDYLGSTINNSIPGETILTTPEGNELILFTAKSILNWYF